MRLAKVLMIVQRVDGIATVFNVIVDCVRVDCVGGGLSSDRRVYVAAACVRLGVGRVVDACAYAVL